MLFGRRVLIRMGMLIGGRVLNQGGAYWKEGAYHKGEA